MLVEVALGAVMVCMVVIMSQWWCMNRLESVIREGLNHVENGSFDLGGLGADLAGEVVETITATMGQMHVPTAADHLFGAVNMWLQAKIMRDLGGGLPMPDNAPSSTENEPPLQA